MYLALGRSEESASRPLRSDLAGRRMRGFGLIELMIAILLGLLVSAAAIAIFQSNRQTYHTIQGLGRVQEGAQMAFVLMARDLREAGANPCEVGLPVANVVNEFTRNWWTNFAQPLIGLDDGAATGSRSGSDAIRILAVGDELVNVIGHSGTLLRVDAARFDMGDVLMVCDLHQLAIFRVTGAVGREIDHARAGGNCSDSLNVTPAPCAADASAYLYQHNAMVGRLNAVQWTARNNGRGGVSLYRTDNGISEEMVEGISDLQLNYLQPEVDADQYVSAGAITDWAKVRAVSIALTLVAGSSSDNGREPIERRLTQVVNLRNRVP